MTTGKHRNPVMTLPAYRRLHELPGPARQSLLEVLRDLAAQAESLAEHSWRTRKGPMAAYWRAVAVYARHIARALTRA